MDGSPVRSRAPGVHLMLSGSSGLGAAIKRRRSRFPRHHARPRAALCCEPSAAHLLTRNGWPCNARVRARQSEVVIKLK